MKPATVINCFSLAIVSAALILAVYTGNPWAGVGPGVLFVFVVYPHWRGKMYHLADKAVGAIGRVFKNDRCDPE